MSRDEATFVSRTLTLGEWVRAPESQAEGDPPHFLGGDLADPRHPNELGIEWADDRHIEAVAVRDWDGCRAIVQGS